MCFAMIILLGGCFVKNNEYNQEEINKAKATIESYLKSNYENIESVEINEVYKGPMGGMRIEGTVNKKYGFEAGVEENDFTIGSISEKKGFPDLKDECKNKTCDY